MAVSWLACCTVREAEGRASLLPCTWPFRGEADALEEDFLFFDCAETENELAALRGHATGRLGAPHGKAPLGGLPDGGRPDCCSDAAGRHCTDLAAARAVLESTREEWSRRVMDLRKTKTSPELEWATLATARRMLKANIGDVKKAVRMFVQALELRARDRHLFQTMCCEARSDVRVMGMDLEGHPVVYMCARSQTESLSNVRDQLVVTLERACKLTSEMGTVAFIVDMHGLQAHLNMDLKAMKDLGDILGTVYAERICRITIVDFPRAALAVWWMVKPMLRPVTKEKFAFVSEAQARQLSRQQLSEQLHNRLCRTFEVNRDPKCTAEDRALQAHRTTLCDMPLGPPLA